MRGDVRDEVLPPGHDVGARLERDVELRGRQRAQHEQRPVEARGTQLARLLGGRDRQPRRAAGQRGARGGDGAVAVPVGLDDRAQRRRRRRARRAARSCARSRPCPPGRALAAPSAPRERFGEPRDHVRGDHAVGAVRRGRQLPGAQVRVDRRAGRGRTGRGPWPAAPPITPESTSPVPAVASAGRAARRHRHAPGRVRRRACRRP